MTAGRASLEEFITPDDLERKWLFTAGERSYSLKIGPQSPGWGRRVSTMDFGLCVDAVTCFLSEADLYIT